MSNELAPTVRVKPHRVFTPEEKKWLVANYYLQKHGSKGAFLKRHNVSGAAILKWRDQMIAGDIDMDLSPRQTVVMSTSEAKEIKRLLEENARLRKANEALRKRAHANQEAAEALGKAIATLQNLPED